MNNKVVLWAIAIAAVLGPCFYISSGNGKVLSGAGQMALIASMKQQVLMLQMGGEEYFGYNSSYDNAGLEKLAALLNERQAPPSAQDKAEMQKQGVNPGMIPKPIPWIVAPAKKERSLALSFDPGSGNLIIQGWGINLEKPIYETSFPVAGATTPATASEPAPTQVPAPTEALVPTEATTPAEAPAPTPEPDPRKLPYSGR